MIFAAVTLIMKKHFNKIEGLYSEAETIINQQTYLLNLLDENVNIGQTIDGLKLKESTIVYDTLNNQYSLKTIMKTGTKLIIKNNQNSCSKCLEDELALLKDTTLGISGENIILITTHSNGRQLLAYKSANGIKCNVYYCKNLEIPFEKEERIFTFVCDTSLVVKQFFIPIPNYPTISKRYYTNLKNNFHF